MTQGEEPFDDEFLKRERAKVNLRLGIKILPAQ